MVEPSEPVAVGEQLLPQQDGPIGRDPAEAGTRWQVLGQEQGDQGSPDLNPQGMGAGANEGLDAEVLLARIEEPVDLPPLAVYRGDGW